jgi:hypothetical protein
MMPPNNRDQTLEVAPASPTTGEEIVFTGCGYEPGVGVTVVVESPSAIAWFGAPAGDDGCFSTAATQVYVPHEAGDYEALTYQSKARRPDAEVTFTVTV